VRVAPREVLGRARLAEAADGPTRFRGTSQMSENVKCPASTSSASATTGAPDGRNSNGCSWFAANGVVRVDRAALDQTWAS
jgi:hypothetical protein